MKSQKEEEKQQEADRLFDEVVDKMWGLIYLGGLKEQEIRRRGFQDILDNWDKMERGTWFRCFEPSCAGYGTSREIQGLPDGVGCWDEEHQRPHAFARKLREERMGGNKEAEEAPPYEV